MYFAITGVKKSFVIPIKHAVIQRFDFYIEWLQSNIKKAKKFQLVYNSITI